MPGSKELEHFRKELSTLGKEREVTEARGDVYEELPLPPAVSTSAPQINVDDLLASLGDGPSGAGEVSLPGEELGIPGFTGADDVGLPGEGFSLPGENDVTLPGAELGLDDLGIPGFDLPGPSVPTPQPNAPRPTADRTPPQNAARPSAPPTRPTPKETPPVAPSRSQKNEDVSLDSFLGGDFNLPSEPVGPTDAVLPSMDFPLPGDGGASIDAAGFSAPNETEFPSAPEIPDSAALFGEPPASDVGVADEFSIPEMDLSSFGAQSSEAFPGDATASAFDIPSSGAPDAGSFDDLLSSLPLDEVPEGLETPSSASPISESSGDAGLDELLPEDDFSVPDNLLSGFADEVDKSRSEGDGFATGDFGADFGELTPQSSASDDFALPVVDESEGLEGLEPVGLSDSPEALGAAEIGSTDDFSFPSGFDMPSMDAGDFGSSGAVGETTAEDMAMDFTPSFETDVPGAPSFPDDSDSALPPVPGPAAITPEEKAPGNPFGEGFEDFSIPDGLAVSEGSGTPEPAEADGFDGFSLDEDFLKTSLDTTAAGGDEFHIPGFSDFTAESGAEKPAGRGGVSDLSAAAVAALKGQKKEVPLQISESDFNKFLSIISTYPLNLRIAIEEYLSGDAGTELQKMELVHNVLGKISVRKLAHVLEGYLSRFIPIPKDYEKKSVEDYEREKASLKYVFLNKILPAALLFTIVAILSFCAVYLSYQFIYRPLAAESLYRRGYAAIQDARYTQSVEYFDQAVQKWEKKPWYFKYARAYRAKKQYNLAETMYERILNRFNNDKVGGLEYAEMLRTELRNFEKAETILKRRLLDNFVNDRDCLLLLGDTYLDWADEDPAKFEDARHTYATLIELYGAQDPYLARMMRYFIRTNNLKEVLLLKEHFMGTKAKIGAQDLVELSGYLLEKRYLPSPGDSPVLIDRIEDVRTLLERAVDSDGTCPEAHYNLGRFFIFNSKNSQAIDALTEALKQFGKAAVMSPRRVMARIDTYRLLGEVCADDSEFLKAQAFYGDGITLYEAQRENRTVNPDPRVGVLYADFADIDYFIANNLDSALYNYRKAIDELHDTPSVRYRVGYIMYQKQAYESAMNEFGRSHRDMPDDRNLLYSYGNTLFRRGDIYASQGYYDRLMDLLEAERVRKGIVLPLGRADHAAFIEEYMHVTNNLGVILDRQSRRTGDSRKKARALTMFAESGRAWDALTRNPDTMVRADGVNLSYLNIQNITHPRSDFESEIYADIPKVLEGEKVLRQIADQ
jgi:tetratricopeptide (TPR) repeat protein